MPFVTCLGFTNKCSCCPADIKNNKKEIVKKHLKIMSVNQMTHAQPYLYHTIMCFRKYPWIPLPRKVF